MEVAGLYLERWGGLLLRAEATYIGDTKGSNDYNHWSLRFIEEERVHWHPSKPETVQAGFDTLNEVISTYTNIVKSISICSYGPFVSLTPGAGYGQLRADTANIPLYGKDLISEFHSGLGNKWLDAPDTRLAVHTDAHACALGEAYTRNTHKDDILAFICVTEGVGLGLVRGRQIMPSALHPEVGLLPAYPHIDDPLAKTNSLPSFSSQALEKYFEALNIRSIEQQASNKALFQRYKRNFPDKAATLANILQSDHSPETKEFWNIRAFYLAQACVACTVIIPPHQIVIGAQFDPLNNVGERTDHFFKLIRRGWKLAQQPAFEYPSLESNHFISEPSLIPGLGQHRSLAYTGAAGMCYAAAQATNEAKIIHKARELV